MSNPPPIPTSLELLAEVQSGNKRALDELCRRYLPHLEDWASGRLPANRRDLSDTDDIVQEVMIRVMSNLDGFEPHNEAALLCYMRRAVRNRITDEIRRGGRRPVDQVVDIETAGGSDPTTPLDHLMGVDLAERYESAMQRLNMTDQKILKARIEFDNDYEKVAAATGKPSAQAARMAASRAQARLATELYQD
jgi:RNA polymerase sigma factor (sigma-70 family)